MKIDGLSHNTELQEQHALAEKRDIDRNREKFNKLVSLLGFKTEFAQLENPQELWLAENASIPPDQLVKRKKIIESFNQRGELNPRNFQTFSQINNERHAQEENGLAENKSFYTRLSETLKGILEGNTRKSALAFLKASGVEEAEKLISSLEELHSYLLYEIDLKAYYENRDVITPDYRQLKDKSIIQVLNEFGSVESFTLALRRLQLLGHNLSIGDFFDNKYDENNNLIENLDERVLSSLKLIAEVSEATFEFTVSILGEKVSYFGLGSFPKGERDLVFLDKLFLDANFREKAFVVLSITDEIKKISGDVGFRIYAGQLVEFDIDDLISEFSLKLELVKYFIACGDKDGFWVLNVREIEQRANHFNRVQIGSKLISRDIGFSQHDLFSHYDYEKLSLVAKYFDSEELGKFVASLYQKFEHFNDNGEMKLKQVIQIVSYLENSKIFSSNFRELLSLADAPNFSSTKYPKRDYAYATSESLFDLDKYLVDVLSNNSLYLKEKNGKQEPIFILINAISSSQFLHQVLLENREKLHGFMSSTDRDNHSILGGEGFDRLLSLLIENSDKTSEDKFTNAINLVFRLGQNDSNDSIKLELDDRQEKLRKLCRHLISELPYKTRLQVISREFNLDKYFNFTNLAEPKFSLVELVAEQDFSKALSFLSGDLIISIDDPKKKVFWKIILDIGSEIGTNFASQIYEIRMDVGLEDDAVLITDFEEKLGTYRKLITRVEQSPSQELRRLRTEVISQLLQVENPEEVFTRIEDIFVKNNLPTVGKVFLVFNYLFPDDVLDQKLRDTKLSPILREAGRNRRKWIIYKDLLNIHIESGNRSLRDFLIFFNESEVVLNKYDQLGIDGLEDDDLSKINLFLNRAERLFGESLLSRRIDYRVGDKKDIEERLQSLKRSLNISSEQRISDRLVEMFARPLGYSTIDEVLTTMKDKKSQADKRGRELFANSREENGDRFIDFVRGDLVKGVRDRYLEGIFQDGSVAKEYLGGSYDDSDSTAFDADTSEVQEIKADFKNTLEQTAYYSKEDVSGTYGNLAFVVRNRGQIFYSDDLRDELKTNFHNFSRSNQLEAFHSRIVGQNHVGIRTGFPLTEVEFMIANNKLIDNDKELKKIFFEIAKNGYYIPVTNTKGRVIFTPEMYDQLRKIFSGIDMFEGGNFDLSNETNLPRNYARDVASVSRDIDTNRKKIESIRRYLQKTIFESAKETGLVVRSEYTGITGIELTDIGSTSRNTNIPGDADFDLILEFDASQFEGKKTADPIIADLADKLGFDLKEAQPYSRSDGSIQLHGVTLEIEGQQVEFDLGFAIRKSDDYGATDQILKSKYNWIRLNLGDEKYTSVLANVVLAKKVLKQAGVYKKTDNGFGGIGVESWILQNGGSFVTACRSFVSAATGTNGETLSYDEFSKKYSVWNIGMNRIGDVDIEELICRNLNEKSYRLMLDVCKDYLNDSIRV